MCMSSSLPFLVEAYNPNKNEPYETSYVASLACESEAILKDTEFGGIRVMKNKSHPNSHPGGGRSFCWTRFMQFISIANAREQGREVLLWEFHLSLSKLQQESLFIFLFHPRGPFPHQIQPTQHLPSTPTAELGRHLKFS